MLKQELIPQQITFEDNTFDEDDQRDFEQDVRDCYEMDRQDQERENESYDEFNDITYYN